MVRGGLGLQGLVGVCLLAIGKAILLNAIAADALTCVSVMVALAICVAVMVSLAIWLAVMPLKRARGTVPLVRLLADRFASTWFTVAFTVALDCTTGNTSVPASVLAAFSSDIFLLVTHLHSHAAQLTHQHSAQSLRVLTRPFAVAVVLYDDLCPTCTPASRGDTLAKLAIHVIVKG
jgi:hypothetical protein